jgi:hypothetical protein
MNFNPDEIDIIGLPDQIRTQVLCDLMRDNKIRMNKIPIEYLNYSIYLCGVSISGCDICHVPDEYKTEELCLTAMVAYYNILEFIPNHFKTSEFYLKYVKKDVNSRTTLYRIPEEFKTEEVCLLSIEKSENSFEYTPDHFKTEEFNMKALKINNYAFVYMKNHHRTEKLCLEAVKLNEYLIRFVPHKLKTREICEIAVKNHIEKINENKELHIFKSMPQHIPKEFKDLKRNFALLTKLHNYMAAKNIS